MKTDSLQRAKQEPTPERLDLGRMTRGILSRQRLRAENRVYAGSGGVSQENWHGGFTPAYLDTQTGIALPSRYADGVPAPIHVLDGLPPHWVLDRDARGRVLRVRPGVIAGFLRNGRFYTREEAAALAIH
jgi:hypothetical protein